MWDTVKGYPVAERREAELVDEFWQPLISAGASTTRFNNTNASALQIVDELLPQEELAEQNVRLNEMEAARLYSPFQELPAEQRSILKKLADRTKHTQHWLGDCKRNLIKSAHSWSRCSRK